MFSAILFMFIAAAHAQTSVPTVNTTQGVIIGAYSDGIANFYGIHYAGSVSGENRFKNPTPAPNYPGDYHAVDNGVICAHPTPRGLVGVEDCLVLNVHTKNLTASNPVIVWLEGEDYDTINTIPYSYNNLVKEDIVFVTVNYRLSIFGFLCLGVPEAPGNVGLKDVVQALTWIQQNIAGFGGNPGNVMLFGHGSGAAMVDLITLSSKADGLVHKAIALSGSALSPSAVAYEPVAYAREVGAKMGYTGKSNKELAELLSKTGADLLVNAINDFEFYNNTPLFAPCVENTQLNPNDTFLTDAPINILRSGNYSHVPYIIGYVDREGTVRAERVLVSNWLTSMDRNFSDFLQADLKFESADNKTAVARNIREFYFAQNSVSMSTIEDFLDYQGDSLITMAVIRGARERALTSTADVRIFEFAYKRPVDPDWAYQQIQLMGVRHGGILSYLFDYNLGVGETTARNTLTTRFANFARTGSQAGYPNFTMWDPVSRSVFNLLYISGGEVGTNVTIFKEEARGNIREETTTFWNNVYSTHYRAPAPISGATADRLAVSLAAVFVALQLLFN